MIKNMEVNTKLSLKGCWRLVNAIQNVETPKELRERADVAIEWLKKNEIISNAEFDDLMKTVAYLVRESYSWERGY